MSEEIATLGGGCFWCLEAVYKDLRGVRSVMSGYAAGHVANPSYKQVCSGNTGHAEVVQIHFDPAEVSYEDLLRVFFTIHDPTTKDRQGHDVGPQYRSIILTHSDAQAQAARAVIKEITDAKVWPAPIVTQVEPLTVFYEVGAGAPRLLRAQSLDRLLPGGCRAEGGEVPQDVLRPVEARGGGVGAAWPATVWSRCRASTISPRHCGD